jgi:hypothetical protein
LPDDQEDDSSWDTWYLHQDITYECIRVFYATADYDEEDVILREKGTVESDNDGNSMMGRIRATGMGCGLGQLGQRVWFNVLM